MADLALAALCHDLGHGPLSHAWEREVIGDFPRNAWATALGLNFDNPVVKNGKWHEVVGQALLGWSDGQLHKVLEDHEIGTSERIRGLLAGEYYLSYLPRLISSDVDVDRADFVMRDTHYTGVAYGKFDLNWLISTCTLGRFHRDGSWQLGFEERKALRALEQFLIARRALYETVYQHKTVRCIEGMVGLFLRRLKEVIRGGVEAEIEKLPVAKPFVAMMKGEPLPPQELMRVDDFVLFVLIDAVAEGLVGDVTAKDLARRIQARDLFKRVPVASEELTELVTSPARLQALHDAVQPFVPGESKYYLAWDTVSFKMFTDDEGASALFIDSAGKATLVQDHPSLLGYRGSPASTRRLFTVKGAVEKAAAIIRQKA